MPRTGRPNNLFAAPRPGASGLHFDGENAQIENGLFNDVDVRHKYRREKPVHRRCAVLAATGLKNVEIAKIVGLSPVSVSTAIRQPHARETIVNTIKEDAAAEQIKRLLETAAPQSIQRIANLAEAKAGTELGFKADLAIVERFMGKPVQPVSQAKPVTEMSDEELMAQIATEKARNGSA